VGQFI
jgi:pimeloyl-ACP methyl ester carboxylesterase